MAHNVHFRGHSKASLDGMAETNRALLARPGAIDLPGCHDELSAMLAESARFESAFLSGYGVAASGFGTPSIGFTTLPETAALAARMVQRLTASARKPSSRHARRVEHHVYDVQAYMEQPYLARTGNPGAD